MADTLLDPTEMPFPLGRQATAQIAGICRHLPVAEETRHRER
jgi:hypothetical protein